MTDIPMTTFGPLRDYPYGMPTATLVAGATRRGDYMQVYSGRKFWPMDARADEVHIEDIAHSLAMQCRYAGHGMQFYSVAEHCVHIYRWLIAENYSYEVRLAGLLHDATEAYLVDVPRPVKGHLPGYKDAERALWRVIAAAFGLPDDLPTAVHDADNRILADEVRQNMAPMDWHAKHDNPLGITLEYWSPQRAEAEFLRAFRTVQQQRQQVRSAAARSAANDNYPEHERAASKADRDYQAMKEAG